MLHTVTTQKDTQTGYLDIPARAEAFHNWVLKTIEPIIIEPSRKMVRDNIMQTISNALSNATPAIITSILEKFQCTTLPDKTYRTIQYETNRKKHTQVLTITLYTYEYNMDVSGYTISMTMIGRRNDGQWSKGTQTVLSTCKHSGVGQLVYHNTQREILEYIYDDVVEEEIRKFREQGAEEIITDLNADTPPEDSDGREEIQGGPVTEEIEIIAKQIADEADRKAHKKGDPLTSIIQAPKKKAKEKEKEEEDEDTHIFS